MIGGIDALAGGNGNDGFFFGADGNLTAADRIDGGAGIDTIALRGNYVGADALEGGAGADTYWYRSAAESTSLGHDSITGFDSSEDRIDAPGGARTLSQSGSGSLSTASFDADLAAGLDGVLGAGQAALFAASAGSLAGRLFAVIDVNGSDGYQAGEDLVIELVAPVLPIDPVTPVIV